MTTDDNDLPQKVDLSIESDETPYLYRMKWDERTVVADHERVWVIDADGRMTDITEWFLPAIW